MHNRNETVDALRGLAALSVCFFHFTNGEHFRQTSYLAPAGAYGWLGVDVFFVISGFIVPYAMLRAGYRLSAWPTFMVKRLVRLEPPYLVSIVIVILLGIASTMAPGFRGPPIDWTPAQIAGHLGYLNTFLGLPWLNPVYWSLAIEFQFYILIGLTLPALLAAPPAARLAAIAFVTLLPMALPQVSAATIGPALPFFAAGLLTFLVTAELVRPAAYWATLAGLGTSLLATRGCVEALAAVAPAAAIAGLRLPRIGPVAWLGAISYSLYLLHVPVGGRIVNLATRVSASPIFELVVVAAALALAIAAAAVLHVMVERPSQRLAARIAYRQGDQVRPAESSNSVAGAAQLAPAPPPSSASHT
jgi:peptidoglycan/LPS O-acetylase OafA/YrhL